MNKKNILVNVITLGCSKNLVDSEYLMKQLESSGFRVVHDSDDAKANVVVINTCGFIKDAKQESIEMILQFEELKKGNQIDKLYVFGCLSERYKADLRSELTLVDEFFGVYDMQKMVESIGATYKTQLLGDRILTTPSHYAYLKVSEGCDRSCSFCAIPLIKGPHKSKDFDSIISEAKILVKKGVKELLFIAQDLTYYGIDIYNDFKIAELVDQLSDIRGLEWIRLHYAYPAKFPKNLIKVMKSKPNVCNYLDIPFQHISSTVLHKMRRGIDREKTLELIDFIRSEIPEIALRTTLLVGHPGEGDQEFAELLDFVAHQKFARLGVFTYSEEEDTYGAKNFKDDLSNSVKQARADEIMILQSGISLENNQKLVGKKLKVLMDRIEGEYIIGRTEYDSPEVDNEVIVPVSKTHKSGSFSNILITKADEYELFGE